MKKSLQIIMQLIRLNALINRRFAVQGLGINEFMVLFYLEQSSEGKLRRVDLAEKLGLTASGVTRILLPMEKMLFSLSKPCPASAVSQKIHLFAMRKKV